jgi:hypothetical protein
LTDTGGDDKIPPLNEPPPSSRGPGRNPFKVKTGVRISVGASDIKRLPTDNVERFLSMLRFDSKGKLGDLDIDIDHFSMLKKK